MSSLHTLSSLQGSLTTNTDGSLYTYDSTSSQWLTVAPQYYTNTYATTGNVYYTSTDIVNPLQSMNYSIDFSIENSHLLNKNIKGIRKNKFLFNCNYDGNRLQPYELLMELIESKQKINVKVKVSDVLTITYNNLQFTEIVNNLDFNTSCNFSVLKVKFKYDEILYENHKLSSKELRTDKLKKIMKNNEESKEID